jgi:hypothetical protein
MATRQASILQFLPHSNSVRRVWLQTTIIPTTSTAQAHDPRDLQVLALSVHEEQTQTPEGALILICRRTILVIRPAIPKAWQNSAPMGPG